MLDLFVPQSRPKFRQQLDKFVTQGEVKTITQGHMITRYEKFTEIAMENITSIIPCSLRSHTKLTRNTLNYNFNGKAQTVRSCILIHKNPQSI
jgi:hypothetical protein